MNGNEQARLCGVPVLMSSSGYSLATASHILRGDGGDHNNRGNGKVEAEAEAELAR